MLRTVLEADGYEVFEAENGAVALDLMRSATPDLVLLDLYMPEKDGFEVIAEVQADPELVKIPVVALTASATYLDRDKARGLGFAAYLTKPISLPDLRAQIRAILEQYQAA